MQTKSLLAALALASAFIPSFADQKVEKAVPGVAPAESELSISAPPASEPSNYALLVAALGVLGFVAHRRSSKR
ncbi:hypothetical protein [Methylibium sp.]|uniref:hypothetical protein n=1 Tax=Methylibium sp. TaxID=2067992 RepID=UPI003D0BA28D